MNKDEDDSRGGLKGFYSYKNTFDADSVWLEIPKQGVFVWVFRGLQATPGLRGHGGTMSN